MPRAKRETPAGENPVSGSLGHYFVRNQVYSVHYRTRNDMEDVKFLADLHQAFMAEQTTARVGPKASRAAGTRPWMIRNNQVYQE